MNEQLRQHVTRVQFDLTLTKTQIAALVLLDQMLIRGEFIHTGRKELPNPDGYWGQRIFSLTVIGSRGLQERGLLEHTPPPPRVPTQPYRETPVRRVWKITKAGRLVIGLLKEAGIYDEVFASLPAVKQTA